MLWKRLQVVQTPCCLLRMLLPPRFVSAGAAVEAVSQRGVTSKTQLDVITRSFNWLVWLLAALNMLEENEVRSMLTWVGL